TLQSPWPARLHRGKRAAARYPIARHSQSFHRIEAAGRAGVAGDELPTAKGKAGSGAQADRSRGRPRFPTNCRPGHQRAVAGMERHSSHGKSGQESECQNCGDRRRQERLAADPRTVTGTGSSLRLRPQILYNAALMVGGLFVMRSLRLAAVVCFLTVLSLAQISRAQSPEEKTAKYLESVRHQPGLLLAFLQQMPKGGDLHVHLSGAIYAE